MSTPASPYYVLYQQDSELEQIKTAKSHHHMLDYASKLYEAQSLKQEAPTSANFATPNNRRKRDAKTSEKDDSTLRRTLARDSTRVPNDF